MAVLLVIKLKLNLTSRLALRNEVASPALGKCKPMWNGICKQKHPKTIATDRQ